MKENNYPGTFIVIEGIDGAGTTTMSRKLAEELDAEYTAEPTSGLIGRKVDELISSDDHMPETVALAFAADRMVHVEEIVSRLQEGETVVCDRYYHSSLVYQSVLGAEEEWIRQLNLYAPRPDLTVILDVEAEIGMDRVNSRGSDDNIFEDLDFQSRVVKKYREIEDELDERIAVVDGTGSIEEVYRQVEKEARTVVTGQ